MLTFFKLFLANKTLTVILLTYGATAGWNWWNNYQERAEWKSAMESYQGAFADAQEQLQRNDDVMRKRLISQRERYEKDTEKTIGLYKVARQEIQNGLGGKCGPFADVVVPSYYFDVLRLGRSEPVTTTDSKNKYTARQWITNQLQKAEGISKAGSDPGAISKEPADWLGPTQLYDDSRKLIR